MKNNIRPSMLPSGWYPPDKASMQDFLQDALHTHSQKSEGLALGSEVTDHPSPAQPAGACACIAPHAGWYFSGNLAARAIASLSPAETIVVVGGHLHRSSPVCYASEEGFETPAGALTADTALLNAFLSELKEEGLSPVIPDTQPDNSVEVLLPMVKILHPGSMVLWLRSPPRFEAKLLGQALARCASTLERSVACVGSTDLTHYGPNYGFMPAGRGKEAVAWVKNKNDKPFLNALLAMDCEAALNLAQKNNSACSAGAAVTALAFALGRGAEQAFLIEYGNSYDRMPSESFVGYAALSFR